MPRCWVRPGPGLDGRGVGPIQFSPIGCNQRRRAVSPTWSSIKADDVDVGRVAIGGVYPAVQHRRISDTERVKDGVPSRTKGSETELLPFGLGHRVDPTHVAGKAPVVGARDAAG